MDLIIVLPVYNESLVLRQSVEKLRQWSQANLSVYHWRLIIADNNSIDDTGSIGRALALEYPEVIYEHVPVKGRGIALRTAWTKYLADWNFYMDIDLAVDLAAVSLVIDQLLAGADAVTGSRFHLQARVTRSWSRGIISWTYSWMTRLILRSKLHDFQCGFKAVNRRIVQELLPQITEDGFFLDTELLVRAERAGYRVVEVPVSWSEFTCAGRHSTVKIFKTAHQFIIKNLALRRQLRKL